MKKELTLKLQGLSDYKIVYGTKSNGECNLAAAEILKTALNKKLGTELEIVDDTTASLGEKCLFVGICKDFDAPALEEMYYTCTIEENSVYFIGGELLSVHMGVADYVEKVLTVNEDSVTFTEYSASLLKVKDQPKTEGTEFRVMTYNIMAEWPGWGGDYMPIVKRAEGFRSIMKAYDPDVAGIQEVSPEWSEYILKEYGDEYEYINRMTPDGLFVNLSTIIYKKSKFDVLDQGLQYFSFNGPNKIRLVDWAIFRDKATGKDFAFFNSHWCFYRAIDNDAQRKSHSEENAVIINKVMADHPDVKYAFSMADFNTPLEHEFAKNFIRDAGLVNSRDIAEKAGTMINCAGGCSRPGTARHMQATSEFCIDNIFVTPNMKVLRHETILWNGVEHVSDHSPKYADFILA